MARHHVLVIGLLAGGLACGPVPAGTETHGEPTTGLVSSSTATTKPDTTSTAGTSATSLTDTAATASSSASTSSIDATSSTASAASSSSTGAPVVCGDALQEGAEECDDGNVVSFDGCSAGCFIEEAIKQICVGGPMKCILDARGRVKCWGANLQGQLGLGFASEGIGDDPGEMGANLPFIDVGMDVVEITCHVFGCALGSEGQVKCWGGLVGEALGIGAHEVIGDEPGEMGEDLPALDLSEPAVALMGGQWSTCAALESGAVKCWGLNADGELGLGDTEIWGDDVSEMGETLPPLDLGDLTPTQITRGGPSACALDAAGRIKCWGRGRLLGLESPESRGDQPGEMGDALPFVNVGTGAEVLRISASTYATCVVLQGGALKCWGRDNNSKVLWPFAFIDYGWQMGEMGDNLPTYDLGGQKAIDVQTGSAYACVQLADKSIKCWGERQGVMGLGDNEIWPGQPLAEVPPIDFGAGEVVKQWSFSSDNGCALLESGFVKCWGRGILGYGEVNDRGDEPGEMGDNLPYVEIF